MPGPIEVEKKKQKGTFQLIVQIWREIKKSPPLNNKIKIFRKKKHITSYCIKFPIQVRTLKGLNVRDVNKIEGISSLEYKANMKIHVY